MQKKQSADNLFLPFVLFFTYTLFCTFSLLLISGFGNFTLSDISLVLISLALSTISFLFCFVKNIRRIYIPLISAGILLLIISDLLGYTDIPKLQIVKGFTEIFIDYSVSVSELTVICIIVLLLSVFAYSFTVKYPDPATLSLFCASMFVFQLMTGGNRGIVYFIFLLAVLLMTMFLRTYIRVDKASFAQNTGLRTVFSFAVVFVAISAAVSSFLPYPDAPLVENIIHSASKGNLSYYSLGSGEEYEEESKLGGKLELSDDEVFTVKTENRIKLIGSVKTEYTGESWRFGERTDEKYSGGASADFAEISHNFNNADIYDTIIFNKAEVQVKDLSGHTLFVPSLITSLEMKNPAVLYISNDGSIFSRQSVAENSYKVENGKIDFKNKDVLSLLKSSKKGSYDKAKNSEIISAEELKDKSDFAYSECLQLPQNLPERVKELAEDITKDCKSDYDKAVAIEEYLSQYRYTTTPPDVIEDADFVDTFLFEQKEGYCSYYATAMAVLARCVDIPARYAEGYALPADFTKEQDMLVYSVTGKEAHSWPQLYFEGIGWVDFEPTPPYNHLEQGEDIPQDIFKNPDDASDFKEALKEDTTSEKEDEAEDPTNETTTEPTSEDIPQTTQKDSQTDKENKEDEPFTDTIWFKILLALLIPVLFISAIFGFSVLTKKLSEKRFEKMCSADGNKSAVQLFFEIERLYKYIGIRRGKDETAGDFLRTSSAIIGIDATCDKIIEQALYGESEIQKSELDLIIEYIKKQKIAVRNGLPKFKKIIFSDLLHIV